MGLPSVVGELAAGILIGPSVFGRSLPQVFGQLFPPKASNFICLKYLAGDGLAACCSPASRPMRVCLRNLGRTAGGASIFGMVVPFVFGLALGMGDARQVRRRTRSPHDSLRSFWRLRCRSARCR